MGGIVGDRLVMKTYGGVDEVKKYRGALPRIWTNTVNELLRA